MTTSRDEFLKLLAGMTADDIAREMDAATTPDEYWAALASALAVVQFPGITYMPEDRPLVTRIREARTRVGLTTSENERKAHNREAEQRLLNERAARRAG